MATLDLYEYQDPETGYVISFKFERTEKGAAQRRACVGLLSRALEEIKGAAQDSNAQDK